MAVRPKLEELRKLLLPGDTIVVTKADWIARSTLGLLQIVASLDDAKVKLEILSGAFTVTIRGARPCSAFRPSLPSLSATSFTRGPWRA